jgi:tRNA wybutosine-synthesizing protein 1
MHVGEAQARLERAAMPSHQEIREFALKLSELIGYEFEDEAPQSRVALLSKR